MEQEGGSASCSPPRAQPFPPVPIHLAHLMLAQQEGQKHEHATIMHDPPHIDVALQVALMVAGVEGNVLGYKQGQVGSCGAAYSVWGKGALVTTSLWPSSLCYLMTLAPGPPGPAQVLALHIPIKVFQARGSSLCRQP